GETGAVWAHAAEPERSTQPKRRAEMLRTDDLFRALEGRLPFRSAVTLRREPHAQAVSADDLEPERSHPHEAVDEAQHDEAGRPEDDVDAPQLDRAEQR